MTVEEGNTLNVKCTVTEGNPYIKIVFRWSDKLSVISSTALLEIHNITRDHGSVYTCFVYNMLQPTFGSNKNGSDFESFYLDVLCK